MLENALVRVLRRGGLPEPVRQYETRGVRLVLAYPDVRLAIEVDSRHGRRLDVERNSDKANVLVAHGWRVLHFGWRHIRYGAAQVITAVTRELAWAA